MLQYLEKYNQIPADVRAQFSQAAVVSAIRNLEYKYGVSLGSVLMRLMIKDLPATNLPVVLANELTLIPPKASELAADLRTSVFFGVLAYLGLAQPEPVAQPKVVDPVGPEKSEDRLDLIIKKAGLSFGASDLNDRLKKLLAIYERGVRDKINTRETLAKPIIAGGLGLDKQTVDRLMILADMPVAELQAVNSAIPAPNLVVNNKANQAIDDLIMGKTFARDAEYDFSKLAKPATAPEKLLTGAPVPSLSREPVPLGVSQPTPASEPVNRPMVMPDNINRSSADIVMPKLHSDYPYDAGAPRPAAPMVSQPVIKQPAINNITKLDSGKIAMADVLNARPKIFTPIDELAFMTIKNFRQMSNNPNDAVTLIKEKISSIAQDDIGLRVEAINAWKQSPVNRMYIQVLKDALNTGQPAIKALAKRRQEEADFLSDVEFEAIIQMNRELK